MSALIVSGRLRESFASEQLCNHERLCVRALYRNAIRRIRRSPQQASWDRLHENLATKDTDHFWKEWKKTYRKNKSHLHPIVDGLSSQKDISESFKSHFINISKPNNADRVDQLKNKFDFKYAELSETHNQSCNCHIYNVY